MPFRQTFQKQRKSPFRPYNPCKRKGVLLYNHNQGTFVQTYPSDQMQIVQLLSELNYPVPALRRGIARKQALS